MQLPPKILSGINFNENKGDSYKLKAGEFFLLKEVNESKRN